MVDEQPTILVPLTFAPLNGAKTDAIRRQARAFGARVSVLHVIDRPPSDENMSHHEAVARTHLAIARAELSRGGLAVDALLREGTAAAGILREARGLEAALIILGGSPRARFWRVRPGEQVSDAVIRDAPCPVLVLPPPESGSVPLRAFGDDARRAGALNRRPPVLTSVELSRIVGSASRAHELGPDFRVLHRSRGDDDRFTRIRATMRSGDAPGLPPLELYKLGPGYYVVEGHRRVAAALSLGFPEFEANVTEFLLPGESSPTAGTIEVDADSPGTR